ILTEKWQYFFRGPQLDSQAAVPFSTILTLFGQHNTPLKVKEKFTYNIIIILLISSLFQTRVVLESSLIKSILSKPLPSPSDDRQYVLQSVLNILVRNSTVECHHLSLLLPHCQLTTKQSKQILCTVLEPWLSQVILEYPRHLEKHNYRLCEDMIAFYLEAFRIVQDQMPLGLIQNAVQCFIDRFQSGMSPECHSILDNL
ncbi:uncharacterized protein LOC103522766, partial [Diaphorina citri]|uniref:Uncharacterized protein LOC103522766 n=1 Tax=Diaphorina citri TaxID=121845 RepID=A0A3Q0JJI8_DIACI